MKRPGGGREVTGLTAGARTPEELETLLEDVLMIGDREELAGLFEDGALLVTQDGQAVRGGSAIAGLALSSWHGELAYVADPQQVLQARDIALIVSSQGMSVMRRGCDGAWRYVIALLSVTEEQETS